MRKLTYEIVKKRCEESNNKTLLWSEKEFEKKYKNSYTKVPVRCNTCGWIWRQCVNKLHRFGCPSCSNRLSLTYKVIKKRCEDNNKTLLWSKDEFEKKYKGNKTKVPVRCNTCGWVWDQIANDLHRFGCPSCFGNAPLTYKIIKKRCEDSNKTLLWSKDECEKKYKNNTTKVPLRCNTCGWIWDQIADNINRTGCPSCFGNAPLTYKIIKKRCEDNNKTLLWDEKEFEKKYKNSYTKAPVRCNKCGWIWDQIISDIDKRGCPECKKEITSKLKSLPFEYFRDKDLKLNGNRDVYYPQYFNKSIGKSKFKCLTCGHVYWQTFDARLHYGCGCPNCCNNGPSKAERQVLEYVKSLYTFTIKSNDRSVIKPLELDIYLPDINLAIEYNGDYWHSREFKPKGYHRNKTQRCADLGIRLFHIPERAWTTERGQALWKLKIKNYIDKKKSDNYRYYTVH